METIQGELVEETTAPLAIRETSPQAAPVALFQGEPADVITQAVKVADALKAVVVAKGLVKRIQGREFVEVAGWQTLGAMTRVTPFCEWTRKLDNGWEARVVVRNAAGADIGAAEAQCTRGESTWAKRDDYALRSMAQTRATSKALRSVLGFIVVLAGYRDTPAEEIPEDDPQTPPAPKEPAKKAAAASDDDRKRGIAAVHALKAERDITDEQYREAMVHLFGPAKFAGLKGPTSTALAYPELRQLWRYLDEQHPKGAAK